MLPPSYLDAMPDAFVQLAQQVEDEILQDVARRIGKMGTLTETADWQLWRYQQTEAVRENVVKLLAKYSGKSEATIRRLLKEAATEAMEREDAIYYHYNLEPTPFEESAALNNLLNAGARQTCGTWQNLTATTANTVTGAFERTLDAAWGKVSTGAFDYKTAVKQAVDSLADDMPMVTYPSGHKDSIEVAARRAVLTGVNQTAGRLKQTVRAAGAGIATLAASFFMSAPAYAAGVQDSQIVKGTEQLIGDVTTWLMVLAPVVAGLLIIYFCIRRGMADEMDQKKWNNRIVVAVVSCIGAVLGSATLNLILGYYQ